MFLLIPAQIYSVILWGFEEYWTFATCIIILATFSLFVMVHETRKSLRALAEIARFECSITVLRAGVFEVRCALELPSANISCSTWHPQEIHSEYLVPGDVVEITNAMTLPCDIALMDGSVVVKCVPVFSFVFSATRGTHV